MQLKRVNKLILINFEPEPEYQVSFYLITMPFHEKCTSLYKQQRTRIALIVHSKCVHILDDNKCRNKTSVWINRRWERNVRPKMSSFVQISNIIQRIQFELNNRLYNTLDWDWTVSSMNWSIVWKWISIVNWIFSNNIQMQSWIRGNFGLFLQYLQGLF